MGLWKAMAGAMIPGAMIGKSRMVVRIAKMIVLANQATTSKTTTKWKWQYHKERQSSTCLIHSSIMQQHQHNII